MNREIAWAVPELKEAYLAIERIADMLSSEEDAASYLQNALDNIENADCALEGMDLS